MASIRDDEIKVNTSYTIKSVRCRRLQEMGFIPGASIFIVRKDPLVVKVKGSTIGLCPYSKIELI